MKKDMFLNFYSVRVFFISNQIHFLIQIAFNTVLFLPFYYIILNHNDSMNFFYFWISIIFFGNAFGRIINSHACILSMQYKVSNHVFLSAINVIMFFSCGFVYRVKDIIWPLRWISFINPIKYIYQIAMLTEF